MKTRLRFSKAPRVCIYILGLLFLFAFLVWSALEYSQSRQQILLARSTETAAALQRCPLPCWEGIVPGQTSHSQLLDLLKSMPHVNGLAGQREIAGAIHRRITWQDSSGITIGSAYVWDDKVQAMQVNWVQQPPLTLSNLINQFGEPEGIKTGDYLYGDHQSGFAVTLYYPKIGAVFSSVTEPISQSRRARVHPELPVPYLSLFTPGSIRNMVATARDSGYVFLISDSGLQNWHGFGEYEILPRSE